MGRHRTSVLQLDDRPRQICINFPPRADFSSTELEQQEGSNSSHTACNEAKAVMDFHL